MPISRRGSGVGMPVFTPSLGPGLYLGPESGAEARGSAVQVRSTMCRLRDSYSIQ